ncbi:protein kinase [uncultured Thiodictyon sp.]|uniref:methylation-associated defense system protein kinase MAD6 n=1 Tax=uncultured Thiodictyon sp. TaxID=1846217 RepID=UPI0025F08B80|nr:protein kinase [uncultured Thiodictyon sp.]
MATVVPIGEPVNDAERQAIAHLRDQLPNSYTLFHNFEVHRDGETFEVDLAVLAPHALYLVDVKGTRGLIDVYGSKWYPEGRQPFTSPLLKLRGHARTVKGILTKSQPGRREIDGVFVEVAVLLTAPDAHLVDQAGRDSEHVTTLPPSAAFFQNAGRIPPRFEKHIAPLHAMVRSALLGAAHRRAGPTVLGDWEVVERLGGNDAFSEYRAINTFAGKRGGTALLRVYRADAYLTGQDARAQQQARIANAFYALNRLPGHPLIAGAKGFFATEGEDRYVLVTEDVAGQALRLHIDKPALALTLDQKLRVARELLGALAFCHAHAVVHRDLSPGTILLGSDGHLRLTGFDHARAGTDRSLTIADAIVDQVDPAYAAPETWREPAHASPASDCFGAGLVLYELFTGQRPFSSPTEVFDQGGVFPIKPSALRAEIAPALDAWLSELCAFNPDQRPTAAAALAALDLALAAPLPVGPVTPPPPPETPAPSGIDWGNVPRGTLLAGKLEVQSRLGRGTFGVVYQVVDTLGDVTRALKLILRDRYSTLERLKKEYKTLVHLPEHPHVVRVIDANVLPADGPPYILFEYVDGEDLGDLIRDARFAPEDALILFRQVAQGLGHLHREGVYHCDIKPHNLLWTVRGAKIIDFNVSVRSQDDSHGGGSRRYLPPDLDLSDTPSPSELVDRDLYALGLTVYEALTGVYPWQSNAPPPATKAPDPRTLPGLADLAPELTALLLKTIAPQRAERFAGAPALIQALEALPRARREPTAETSDGLLAPELMTEPGGGKVLPNTNPFVGYLLTLYSQSPQTNAGTRGLDELGRRTYVPTLLDTGLMPEVIAGRFRLVLITGNAGDGKTAFLQQLETQAGTPLAAGEALVNGRRFTAGGRSFLTNYDGSQDEEDSPNGEVLRAFFAPFQGDDPDAWPDHETRLVAINEGRLVDFLRTEQAQFPALLRLVETGLHTGTDAHGVAVVNLNLRSVVAGSQGRDDSILERQTRLLAHPRFWQACQGCDLKDRCYALHNAQTFQDRTAGPQVLERLKTLYTLTHLRGRLHLTLRDLRSALAFTLASARDCAGIHRLYAEGRRDAIAAGFYFNAWMGADAATADRLLSLLRGVDVGAASDPRLDRGLDFVSPVQDRSRFGFADRGRYDQEVLGALYADLPRDFSGKPTPHRVATHRRYVAMVRRRAFFERRDSGWRGMLPYRCAERMLRMVRGESPPHPELPQILQAINRGEGLLDPTRLPAGLALQVRQVERGTIRSYRLYAANRFHLTVSDAASGARFVEHMPDSLSLRCDEHGNPPSPALPHQGGGSGGARSRRDFHGNAAQLAIKLDIFEMLDRLNHGYRPSPEEEQGYYLSLAVFKNVLGSAPYQEVLLTTTGHDFYRIERHPDERLEMTHLAGSAPVPPPAAGAAPAPSPRGG